MDATITASSEDANYGRSALQDIHLANTFRFTGDTSENIVFDLGSAMAVSSCGIISNLTASATITLEGNSSDSWGSPAVSESITAADRNLMHYFTEETYRYWRLVFADAANPDTYIEIELVFLGGYLQMPGIDPQIDESLKSKSSVAVSPGGQPFGTRRAILETYGFSFPHLTETEKANVRTMYREVEHLTPVWVAVWEDSFSVLEPKYLRITNSTLGLKRNRYGQNVLSLDFEESK